jgi:hypothetical protein
MRWLITPKRRASLRDRSGYSEFMIIHAIAGEALRLSAALMRIVVFLLPSFLWAGAADLPRAAQPPLKALFIAGGGFHDYEKLAPYLTAQISQLVQLSPSR